MFVCLWHQWCSVIAVDVVRVTSSDLMVVVLSLHTFKKTFATEVCVFLVVVVVGWLLSLLFTFSFSSLSARLILPLQSPPTCPLTVSMVAAAAGIRANSRVRLMPFLCRTFAVVVDVDVVDTLVDWT